MDHHALQVPIRVPCAIPKETRWYFTLCVDYQALNKITVKNKYPILLTADLFDRLGGVTVFTTIDLRTGYWQVRIAEGDEHKMTLLLTELLKKVTPWDWGPKRAEAFDTLKMAMSSIPVLSLPDLAKPFEPDGAIQWHAKGISPALCDRIAEELGKSSGCFSTVFQFTK
nr:uncharacterized protein LOC104102097 [Nicotiana tomentosiformis]